MRPSSPLFVFIRWWKTSFSSFFFDRKHTDAFYPPGLIPWQKSAFWTFFSVQNPFFSPLFPVGFIKE